MLITTDALVEGIHFDLMYTPLMHLGYKAVVVNLSDIYAMNGTPTQFVVSMAMSNRFSVEALDELYSGMKKACEIYGVDMVGGDTCSSPKGLFISITALGTVSDDQVVYRHGAKPGDILCVTGDLGAAYLGLQLLEREKQVYLADPNMQPDFNKSKYLIERQLKPEARQDMIRTFKEFKFKPTSMIDISDGLASEVFHIGNNSGAGVVVEESMVPIHKETEELALEFRIPPITCALSGGEDYELLFTADPKDLNKVRVLPDVSIIGEVTEKDKGFKLISSGGKEHDLVAQGWRHFGSD